MTDPKQIDSLTQLKLTKAIQKAASVALVSDKDRSQIIADQLDKDSVPKSLTKVATQAFNRRIAVATIGSRPDQEKAEDFPLADIDKVASLRGVQYMQKAASVSQAPFSFVLHTPQPAAMKKVASAQKEFPRMSWEQLQTKIQNYLQKQAAYINNYNLQLMSDQGDTQQLVKKASQQLQSDPKSKQLLYNVYTDAFHAVFPKLSQGMQKTASYTILPDNQCVQTTERAIVQSAVLQDKKDHFVKVAKELQKVVQSANKVQQAIYDGILHKKADGYTIVKDIAGNVAAAPVLAALGGAKGFGQQAASVLADAGKAMFSKDYAVSPSSAITAKLMSTDRYDDAKMALIRTLSDKNFKGWKAKEVADAVQNVIANNQNMQSPKNNRALKASVAEYLLNQGKDNMASLSAYTKMMKDITQARKAESETNKMTKIKALSSQGTRSDAPSLDFSVLKENLGNAAKGLQLPYDLGKDVDDYKKQKQREQEAVRKAMDQQQRQQAKRMGDVAQRKKDAIFQLMFTGAKKHHSHIKNIADFNALSANRKAALYALAKRDFENLPQASQKALMETAGYTASSFKPGKNKSGKNKGQNNQQNTNSSSTTP